MNILFICRYNRFRSVLAEGLFKKYNTKKRFKAKSAGIIKSHPIDANTRHLAKQLGARIKKTPERLTSKILEWQDLIVIVADNVPLSLFKNKRHFKKAIVWEMKDVSTDKESKGLAKRIESKVKSLVKKLK